MLNTFDVCISSHYFKFTYCTNKIVIITCCSWTFGAMEILQRMMQKSSGSHAEHSPHINATQTQVTNRIFKFILYPIVKDFFLKMFHGITIFQNKWIITEAWGMIDFHYFLSKSADWFTQNIFLGIYCFWWLCWEVIEIIIRLILELSSVLDMSIYYYYELVHIWMTFILKKLIFLDFFKYKQ